VGGRDQGRHQGHVAGDIWPVGGGGERGARPHVSGQHHQAAGERGSGEKAIAARGPCERRLQRGDEWQERKAREEADEDRRHHAAAVVGEEAGQLGGRGARRRKHTLDQVGDDEQDRGRQATQAR
jgi:hypothetical protein